MPRSLDSVTLGGYVEGIEVDEDELNSVVAMLGITDPERASAARDQIYNRLEDLKTARSRTAKAKPIRGDLQDLKGLETVFRSKEIEADHHRALDALESLQTSNPVLSRRLQWQLRPRRIHDLITAIERESEPLEGIAQTVLAAIAALREEIRAEDGRGAPADVPARRFAFSLFQIWTEFTGRGTSRQNALGRERDPFGDFVDAAGKLIDPDFNGHYAARLIHEGSREEGAAGP